MRLETEAISSIKNEIAFGKYELVWSYMLDYENNKNPFDNKHDEIMGWSNIAVENIQFNEIIEARQRHYMTLGLKPEDAVHLACADETGCAYFITTDKGVLRKQTYIPEIRILNPVLFVYEQQGK